jgi:hypothetical protein
MKKLNELYAEFKLWRSMRGMSELGRELHESFEVDEWTWDRFTIDCKKSGIKIWYANDWDYFRFYALPHSGLEKEAELITLLNKADKKFLFKYVQDWIKANELTKPQIAINIIRAARYKDD